MSIFQYNVIIISSSPFLPCYLRRSISLLCLFFVVRRMISSTSQSAICCLIIMYQGCACISISNFLQWWWGNLLRSWVCVCVCVGRRELENDYFVEGWLKGWLVLSSLCEWGLFVSFLSFFFVSRSCNQPECGDVACLNWSRFDLAPNLRNINTTLTL